MQTGCSKMKNMKLLREYVRSVMNEGILEPSEEKRESVQEAARVMQDVNSWLAANKEDIFKAADYYNNPVPQERSGLADLVRSAFANDKNKGYEYPYTTFSLCMQIAGSTDIFTTELLGDITGAVSGMFSSFLSMFENKRQIKEAFQLGAGAIAAIVAAILWGFDAFDNLDEEDLGVLPATADAVRNSSSKKVMEISRAVKPVDRDVAAALVQIADGSKTEQINL
jgi:hypothetical protein